jgi:hypothetical protein
MAFFPVKTSVGRNPRCGPTPRQRQGQYDRTNKTLARRMSGRLAGGPRCREKIKVCHPNTAAIPPLPRTFLPIIFLFLVSKLCLVRPRPQDPLTGIPTRLVVDSLLTNERGATTPRELELDNGQTAARSAVGMRHGAAPNLNERYVYRLPRTCSRTARRRRVS